MPSTTDLLAHAVGKNPVDFADTFDTLVRQRALEALDAKKIELAHSIYGEEPDTVEDETSADDSVSSADVEFDDIDLEDLDLDDLDDIDDIDDIDIDLEGNLDGNEDA